MKKTEEIKKLIELYRSIKPMIELRILEFKNIWLYENNDRLFIELVFCLLTPQTGARRSWSATCSLQEKNLLFSGEFDPIRDVLNIVRFKNCKAKRIIEARKFLNAPYMGLRRVLEQFQNAELKREFLVCEVNGFGYKEASHYLRNIGFCEDIAILDRHILRCMAELGMIQSVPRHLSPKLYLDYEARLKIFCGKVNIPLSHIDLLFWYRQKGEIFK